jgi:hypothetical protein
MAAILGIVIVGMFMLFDSSYLVLFKPWLICAVTYIVVMVAIVACRSLSTPPVVIVNVTNQPGRAFSADFAGAYDNRHGWSRQPLTLDLMVEPTASGLLDDRSGEAGFWRNPPLAPPDRSPAVTRSETSSGPKDLIWTRAVNGLYTADKAGYIVTIQELTPTLWSWVITANGAILGKAQASSFSEAEESALIRLGTL